MKQVLIASLLAAQVMTTPAFAASLEDHPAAAQSRSGAFAGARIRIGFGGRDHGKARAGLTLAPMSRSATADGVIQRRFAEGIEYGFRGNERAQLSIAGQLIEKRRLGAQDDKDEDDDDGGIPTWALVAGGVVIAAGVGLAIFIDAVNDASE
jgi:hypothetical protein